MPFMGMSALPSRTSCTAALAASSSGPSKSTISYSAGSSFISRSRARISSFLPSRVPSTTPRRWALTTALRAGSSWALARTMRFLFL